MQFKTSIKLVCITLLCIFGCFTSIHAQSKTQDGIEVRVDTDKEEYNNHDQAQIDVHVKNTNSYDVNNVHVSTSVPSGLFVKDKSKFALFLDQLKPNEEQEYHLYVTKTQQAQVPVNKDHSVDTGVDNTVGLMIGTLLLSGGAAYLLLKKRKRLGVILLVVIMGVSGLQIPQAKAKSEQRSFAFASVLNFPDKKFKLNTKVMYDYILKDEEVIKGEVTREELVYAYIDALHMQAKEITAYSFDDANEVKDPAKIEKAIQAGFIELSPNDDNMLLFQPHAYATREFAAYTAVRSLGLVVTEADATINVQDKADLSYPKEDQVALSYGMLSSIEQQFMPQRYLNKQEMSTILQKMKDTIDATKINKDHKNQVTFVDGIEQSTLRYVLDEEKHQVIINTSEAIAHWKPGELHILYEKEKAYKDIAIRILSIKEDHGKKVISYEEPKPEEYAKEIDLEGIKAVQGIFTPAEDVEVISKSRIAASGSIPIDGSFQLKYALDDETNVNLKVALKEIEYRINANLTLLHGIEIDDFYVALSNENEISLSCEKDFYKHEVKKKKLGSVDLPIGYGVSASGDIYLEVAIDGSITLSFTNINKMGIQYCNQRMRTIFETDNSIDAFKAEVNAKAGIRPEIGGEFLGFDLFKIGVSAGLGFTIEFNDHYDQPIGFCIDMAGYLYSNIFARLGPDELELSIERELYNADHTLFKKDYHIEETGFKGACTRADGDYEGIVKAAHDDKTIEHAKIEVIRNKKVVDTTTSGHNGEFKGIKLKRGDYTLRVSASGYRPYEQNLTITSQTTTYLETQLMIENELSKQQVTCQGRVKDAVQGTYVDRASIQIVKQALHANDEVVKTIKTDRDGAYQVSLPAGNYEFVVTKKNYVTTHKNVSLAKSKADINLVLNPLITTKGVLRVVLTWGEKPRDLDSHLTSNNRQHVYYGSRREEGANLDVDDTTSYGPETITVTESTQDIYHYYVHDYTNRYESTSHALSASSAQVKVYNKEKLLYTFNVPHGKAGTLWHVFDYNSKTDTIQPANQMSYESSPYNVGNKTRAIISLEIEALDQKE